MQKRTRKTIILIGTVSLLAPLVWLGWRFAPVNVVRPNPQIEALIEKLASTGSPPEFSGHPPHFFERELFENPGDWDPEAQKVVSDAYYELQTLGKPAIPYLINHIDDERYSHTRSFTTFYSVSVGIACKTLIGSYVGAGGSGYKHRETPTGSLSYGEFDLENYIKNNFGSYAAWWRFNRNRTAQQMAVDAIKWREAQELRNGFISDEQRDDVLKGIKEALESAIQEREPMTMTIPDRYYWADELAHRYNERRRAQERREKSEAK